MKFLLTHVAFDCYLDDEDWTEKDQDETEQHLPKAYIGTVWEADDEEDLLEQISSKSGWCVDSYDYTIMPAKM